ncbi:S-layer protein [Secundilactobacillus kimchicus]|uniref:S-layer protein n=1 Tax=Secundilactobacillus kimchicus TaxID=528209 RepID=UPI001C01F2BB|nr:S-layer protein [Secundilactobacillus kimchicus]MBT9672463.1 S-layer protein [Secundilactobacillus kimchicus]
MQTNLKKSLYLSLAAVSFLAAGAVASTQASAKTYAKVASMQSLKTDANTRNVIVTGNNAIATKAATMQGARTIKSAAALQSAQSSDKVGSFNFRAYAVATTDRGSVYYKVVSFDKSVRGWIYGGTSTSSFGGGLQQFATTSTPATINKSFTYNGQKLWASPAWTQYRVGASKLTMANGTKFTVNASTTNVKSGDLYYQIADGSAAGAWVKASDVENAATPIANNAVRINLVNQSGTVIKSIDYTVNNATKGNTLGALTATNGVYSWKLSTADTSAIQTQINNALVGTGYALTNNALSDAQIAALAQAKFGDAVSLSFANGNVVYSTITPYGRNTATAAATKLVASKTAVSNATATINSKSVAATDLANMNSTDLAALLTAGVKSDSDASTLNTAFKTQTEGQFIPVTDMAITDLFSGSKGASFTGDQVMSYVRGKSTINTLKSPVYPVISYNNGAPKLTWAQFTYTAASADAGTFGNPVNVVYSYDPSAAVAISAPTTTQTTLPGQTNPLTK